MPKLCNFLKLYAHNPPVIVSKITGKLVRHGGSSHRIAFWAGYDGLRGGMYPPTRNGSMTDTAYRAGSAYRRRVDKGKAKPLPDNQGSTIIR